MHSILSFTGQLLSFTFFCHVWTDLPYASFKQTLAPPPPLAIYISLKKYCELVSLTHSYHTYKLYIQKKIHVCTPPNFDEWNDAKIPFNTQVCLNFQFMHSNIRSESTHIWHQAHSKSSGACSLKIANITANLWAKTCYSIIEMWSNFVQIFWSA